MANTYNLKGNYKEKIKKLLALSESPNEHEAKAVLLKARQLMAEYKLTEKEIKVIENIIVKSIVTDIVFSARKKPWIAELALVIGKNYCCKCYRSHRYRKRTNNIGFIGLEDDVEICITIFRYTVNYVLSEIQNIEKQFSVYSKNYIRQVCDSYGYGFADGILEAFKLDFPYDFCWKS